MADELKKATRKPRRDSLRNRALLLAAAADVFRAGGADASLEAVARQAGVGIGTLYRHFPTREALFEAVYRHEVEQLFDLAVDLGATKQPVEALRRWLHASVRLVATKKGMLSALALAVDSSSELYAYSSQRLTMAIDLLLVRAVDAGQIRSDITADDLLHTLIGMCLIRSGSGWEPTVIRLVDIFLDGLCLSGDEKAR